MNIITNGFQYELVVAHKFLCVPAVLSMIVATTDILNLNQDKIAEYFGVNVPVGSDDGLINNVKQINDENSWGVVISNNEVNGFFEHFGIPLEEHFIHVNTIAEYYFEDLIKNLLEDKKHIICGYDYYSLNLQNANSMRIGHVSIIKAIKNGNIVIIDPGPKDPGEKIIKPEDLFFAIKRKSNGLWIISEKEVIDS